MMGLGGIRSSRLNTEREAIFRISHTQKWLGSKDRKSGDRDIVTTVRTAAVGDALPVGSIGRCPVAIVHGGGSDNETQHHLMYNKCLQWAKLSFPPGAVDMKFELVELQKDMTKGDFILDVHGRRFCDDNGDATAGKKKGGPKRNVFWWDQLCSTVKTDLGDSRTPQKDCDIWLVVQWPTSKSMEILGLITTWTQQISNQGFPASGFGGNEAKYFSEGEDDSFRGVGFSWIKSQSLPNEARYKGVMTAAVRKLVNVLSPTNLCIATIHQDNIKSRAVAERAGFRVIGREGIGDLTWDKNNGRKMVTYIV